MIHTQPLIVLARHVGMVCSQRLLAKSDSQPGLLATSAGQARCVGQICRSRDFLQNPYRPDTM